jgi:hypothetical protein
MRGALTYVFVHLLYKPRNPQIVGSNPSPATYTPYSIECLDDGWSK